MIYPLIVPEMFDNFQFSRLGEITRIIQQMRRRFEFHQLLNIVRH